MSKDTRLGTRTNQKTLTNAIPERLGKFIIAALTKLKNIWQHENALTGIQFYGDLDD